ncbi:MAG: hypothetical protein RBS68_02065 [Anaerolineales bacterium]|jgi:hypothetical protein|nr:hypothetical protein [Anaerolineales bacterium]
MKNKTILLAVFVLAGLLLSACKVNFITDLQSSGAGTYTQEIGFEGDEASMAGLSDGSEDFCAKQNEELPPGTSIRQETRNEAETWCVYETPFKSIEELQAIYGATDTRINEISIVDGKLTYDISLDLSGDSGAPMGADIFWIVNMPGKLIENNASQQSDNTLKWKLVGGELNNIRAVSEIGGLNFDLGGDWVGYVLGGGFLLCVCCFVPLVIAALAFFLIRRKKQAEPSAA